MKSKLIMLNNDASNVGLRNSDLKKEYVNKFNSNCTVTGYEWLGNITPEIDADFPVSNLLNNHIYKESRSLTKQSGPLYTAGFTIEFENSNEIYNTILLQFNKLNDKLRTQGKDNTVRVELEDAITGNIMYNFIYNENTLGDTVNYAADFYGAGLDLYEITTGKLNMEEGFILIDEDLTNNLDKQDFQLNDYKINIYITSSVDFEYFSLSNIAVCNSFIVKLNENFKYKFKNLNKVSENKRTGSIFTQINSNQKEADATLKFFDNTEQMQFDAFLRYTENSPFYLFPLCESNETTDYKDSQNNYKWGGLFTLKKDLEINLKEYGLYLSSLSLEEYK